MRPGRLPLNHPAEQRARAKLRTTERHEEEKPKPKVVAMKIPFSYNGKK